MNSAPVVARGAASLPSPKRRTHFTHKTTFPRGVACKHKHRHTLLLCCTFTAQPRRGTTSRKRGTHWCIVRLGGGLYASRRPPPIARPCCSTCAPWRAAAGASCRRMRSCGLPQKQHHWDPWCCCTTPCWVQCCSWMAAPLSLGRPLRTRPFPCLSRPLPPRSCPACLCCAKP